jgi:hypothetical protein
LFVVPLGSKPAMRARKSLCAILLVINMATPCLVNAQSIASGTELSTEVLHDLPAHEVHYMLVFIRLNLAAEPREPPSRGPPPRGPPPFFNSSTETLPLFPPDLEAQVDFSNWRIGGGPFCCSNSSIQLCTGLPKFLILMNQFQFSSRRDVPLDDRAVRH